MVETNQKFGYPEWLRARLARETRIITLRELIKEYEKETGRFLSERAYQKGFVKVAGSSAARREQLYWWPNGSITEMKRTGNEPRSIGKSANEPASPIHSSHRYRFCILYKGEQPKDGKVRPWGNPKAKVRQFQTEYELTDDCTIQVFKNRIRIMLHNPEGSTAQQQTIQAARESFLAILGFAKEHNLILDGTLEKEMNPHFVLEKDYMNKDIQASLGEFAKEIEQRTGTQINGGSSHPGKVQHQGIVRPDGSVLNGADVAKRFEWLVMDFPQQFAIVAQDQAHLSENHRSHVAAIQRLDHAVENMEAVLARIAQALEGMKKC